MKITEAVGELKETLSSDKRRLGFFMGAGTSKAIGIPDINELTEAVLSSIIPDDKSKIDKIKIKCGAASPNIEDILNRIRLISGLMSNDEAEYDGLIGKDSCVQLDKRVCSLISNYVSIEPPKGYKTHDAFARWLKHSQGSRQTPIEVFTTNYDLQFERAFDKARIPYFDGFVGGYNPFFFPDAVAFPRVNAEGRGLPPVTWLRLWKMHGSINWHSEKNDSGMTFMRGGRSKTDESELMIFPSQEKYYESRRLPFLTIHDRFRDYLRDGELLLIISGYSFNDQHINETLFDSLAINPRLAITALIFGEGAIDSRRQTKENLLAEGQKNQNFSIYGPDKFCVGGVVGEWEELPVEASATSKLYWDSTNKQCTLGDFNEFINFLKTFHPKEVTASVSA